MHEIGSKKTGSGTDDVYISQWKYMKTMRFVADVREPDEATSTLNITSNYDKDELSVSKQRG